MLLVRHASAGSRTEWDGPDELRPLDDRGREQARELVARLARRDVTDILTSPAVRCVETVAALAAALDLEPELRPELGESRQETDGIALVRALAGRDVVVCGHGGLEAALVDPPRWRKGAALVVGVDLRVVETL